MAKEISWWPHPKTIRNKFLDAGHWTPTHERWFQTRLDIMRSKKQDVVLQRIFSQNEWRDHLRRYSKAAKALENNCTLSSNFLLA